MLRKHSGEVFLAKSGEAGTERIALGRRAGKCEQRETFRKTVTPTRKKQFLGTAFFN